MWDHERHGGLGPGSSIGLDHEIEPNFRQRGRSAAGVVVRAGGSAVASDAGARMDVGAQHHARSSVIQGLNFQGHGGRAAGFPGHDLSGRTVCRLAGGDL